MKVIDIIRRLLPDGTDGRGEFLVLEEDYWPAENNVELCPVWPPDIFAVIGTIIDKSSCYTEVGSSLDNIDEHKAYLKDVSDVVTEWKSSEEYLLRVPTRVQELWEEVVGKYGETEITDVILVPSLISTLLRLFAYTDEVCKGIGWGGSTDTNPFVDLAMASFVNEPFVYEDVPLLPNRPNTLCALVPPWEVVVMPKTLTATVGCTIRSLSHNLALLPGLAQCRPAWALTNETEADDSYKPIRLLVIPFPFSIPAESFRKAIDPKPLNEMTYSAAFFDLEQRWLVDVKGKGLTAKKIFNYVIKPLLDDANKVHYSTPVTGIIMPECALSEKIADDLGNLLGKTGLSFFTTGILSVNPANGKPRNIAKTYVLNGSKRPQRLEQYKHHRWRLDQRQCEQYGLNFHRLSKAKRWWENIDVSIRQLPFFALRKHMSMTVLICEDLARNDPAMNAVRAVGPNLVIALLMDGPQLSHRWPAQYASVLGEDPGSGVLSVTCAAMVDRSNDNYEAKEGAVKRRVIALWRSEDGAKRELELPEGQHALVLDIDVQISEQHTLDARADSFGSRSLSLSKRVTPLKLEKVPDWL